MNKAVFKVTMLWRILISGMILQMAASADLSAQDEQLRTQELQQELQLQQQRYSQLGEVQIQQQINNIIQQQLEMQERLQIEKLRQQMEAERLKVHMSPGEIEEADDLEEAEEYVQLTDKPVATLKKSKNLMIPRKDYESQLRTENPNSLKKQGQATANWGEFSCCRKALAIQTRERSSNSRFIQIQSRECSWNYCKTCVDDLPTCASLRTSQNACGSDSNYRGFMSRHCPKTCGWCDERGQSRVTVQRTTASPPEPRVNPNLREVFVHISGASSPYVYRFTTSSSQPQLPWKLASQSTNPNEVTSFFLFARPTGQYRMAIYVCSARYRTYRKYKINQLPCSRGWKQELKLYASSKPLPNSELISIGGRGETPWTTRVFKGAPCCGYQRSPFSIFVPKPQQRQATTTTAQPFTTKARRLITSTTRRPITRTTRRPITRATREPIRTIRPTTTQSSAQGSPTSSFQRQCLERHNFFRAMHGVPPLQWDSSLAKTSKRWARFLVVSAPDHPYTVKAGVRRTRNWPHSDRGTQYRGRGVGENIAWDFSVDGSPAEESVLRWYAEIFDYDRNNPTVSTPDKPIGHYTQMLWKDSTHLGCSVAVKTINRNGYRYKSTYTVAHYAPPGNVRYYKPSDTLAVYSRNVPIADKGTCSSSPSCSVHNGQQNRCMGYDNKMRCGCARDAAGVFGGRPRCTGSGGCMVVCKRPPSLGPVFWNNECEGQTSCECVYTPRNNRLGAICS